MSVEIDRNQSASEPASRGGTMQDVAGDLARVLDALGSQLVHSVEESTREWADVGAAFDRLATVNATLEALSEAMPLAVAIEAQSEEIRSALSSAVVALQHHDRLSQRLGHIRSGIVHLRDLLRDGVERSSSEWRLRLAAVEHLQREEQNRLVAAESAPVGSVELF
jgi:hypothetical protein